MFSKKIRYKYEDDYENESEYEESDNGISHILPPPLELKWFDYAIAIALGVVATFVATALMPSGLHPCAWFDCAQAAELRAPANIFPGIWRLLVKTLYSIVGINGGGKILAMLGKVSLGLIATSSYLCFKALLLLLIRKLPPEGLWNRLLSRILAATSAIVLVCADPIWNVCQAFTSDTFLVLLFFLTTTLWIRFFRDGKLSAAYFAMFFAGLFTAESPFGLLCLLGAWISYVILLRHGFLGQVELVNLFIQQNAKWLLTFCGAGGFFFGAAVNVIGFLSLDGLNANDIALGEVPVLYAKQFFFHFVEAASAGGWIIGIGIALMPLIIVLALVTRASDVEQFLKYQIGLIFFLVGCIAYSQLASLRPLWFWVWIQSPEMISNQVLLSIFSAFSATTLLCCMTIVVIDALCRNNRRLAQQLDPESVADHDPEITLGRHLFRASLLLAILCAIVLGVIPGRIQPTTKKMLRLIDSYVNEIINEAGDAKYLFTDGSYDCAIELQALANGKDLRCISLMTTPNSRTTYMCSSLLPDLEDKMSIKMSGSNLLRTWERDKPQRIDESAMQLGLELWRRHGKPYPEIASVCARNKEKWTNEELERFRRNGHTLAEEIINIYSAGGPSKRAGKLVNELFLYMQWRIARLAKVRSEIFDARGLKDRANEDVRIATALDNKNDSFQRIIDAMVRLRELTMRQMTPREGLQFALVRADFLLARKYAENILDADPTDPDANFGMGMSYFIEEQWARAEEYLRRALKKRPSEPALWNNIAVIKLHTGNFEGAKKIALKALELAPNSAEVKDTLLQIERAIQEKAEGDATNNVNKVSAPATKKPAISVKQRVGNQVVSPAKKEETK